VQRSHVVHGQVGTFSTQHYPMWFLGTALLVSWLCSTSTGPQITEWELSQHDRASPI